MSTIGVRALRCRSAHKLLRSQVNALGGAGSYHLSANFVAIRMAAIFGGRHLAGVRPAHVDAEYRGIVDASDLLLCGAGSRRAFLNEWLVNEQRRRRRPADDRAVALPQGAVGDVCLIPIDESGNQVLLHSFNGRGGFASFH